ncbi:MAG: contractile injection system protein, VgrG/Pvc8 family [Planctomycetota bacterium]
MPNEQEASFDDLWASEPSDDTDPSSPADVDIGDFEVFNTSPSDAGDKVFELVKPEAGDDEPPYVITEDDGFVPVSMTVQERLCRPFRIVLELTERQDGDFSLPDEDPVGTQVSIRINPATPPSTGGSTGSDSDPVSIGRCLHGYVTQFARLGEYNGATRYRVVVGPGIWPLGRTLRTRIFHNRSVTEIVRALLRTVNQLYAIPDDRGYMVWGTNEQPFPRYEQVVQYRESDLDFIHRLLEQEGLWYRFKPVTGTDSEGNQFAIGHRLVLNDEAWLSGEQPTESSPLNTLWSTLVLAGNDAADLERLTSLRETGAEMLRGTDWISQKALRQHWPERVRINAFEYHNADGSAKDAGLRVLPASTVDGLESTTSAAAIERGYVGPDGDEPSEPIDRFDLVDELTNVAQEGGQAGYETGPVSPREYMQYHAEIAVQRRYWRKHLIEGTTNARAVRPGALMRLVGTGGASVTDQAVRVIASESVYHREGDDFSTGGGPPACATRFRAVPQSVPYRPTKKAPTPEIPGVVTATVVTTSASDGLEVTDPENTPVFDEFGRTRVQFHWHGDAVKLARGPGLREEYTDDWPPDALAEELQCTAWVRVAQPHVTAGSKGGSTFVPRIGTEVLVQFVGGSPDRPVIIGSLYNADQPRFESLNKKRMGEDDGSDSANDRPWNTNHLTIRDHAGNEFGMDGNPGSESIYLSSAQGEGQSDWWTSYLWLGKNWTDRGTDPTNKAYSGIGFHTDGDMLVWTKGKKTEVIKGKAAKGNWGSEFKFSGGSKGSVWIGAKYDAELSVAAKVSLSSSFSFGAKLIDVSVSYTGYKASYSGTVLEQKITSGDYKQQTFGDALYRAVGESKFYSFGDTTIMGGLPGTPPNPSDYRKEGAIGAGMIGGALGIMALASGSDDNDEASLGTGLAAVGTATLTAIGTTAAAAKSQAAAATAVDALVDAGAKFASRIRLKKSKLMVAAGDSRLEIKQNGDIYLLRAKKHGIRITANGVEILGPLTVGDFKCNGEMDVPMFICTVGKKAVVLPNPPPLD